MTSFKSGWPTETGNFAYFQGSRAQWDAERQAPKDFDPNVKQQLGDVNETSAKEIESAMEDLTKEIKSTIVDESLPVDEQK